MTTDFAPLQDLPVLTEPDLSPNAFTVLEHRYLMRDDDGQVVETPAQLFRRVAKAVADAEGRWAIAASERERLEHEFYRLMATRRFLPNSPTLMNAGRRLGMLSACFVLPLEDSIPDIMETARQIALVQRAGGGTGIDLSRLRPQGVDRPLFGRDHGRPPFLPQDAFGRHRGHPARSVPPRGQHGRDACGPSRHRRLHRPQVRPGSGHELQPVCGHDRRLHGGPQSRNRSESTSWSIRTRARRARLRRTRALRTTVVNRRSSTDRYFTVRDIWNRILERAWQSGDPGLIFIDEINRHNPTPHLGAIGATNPCGEQPLLPYEACNLGSINLAAFLTPSSADVRRRPYRLVCASTNGRTRRPLSRQRRGGQQVSDQGD